MMKFIFEIKTVDENNEIDKIRLNSIRKLMHCFEMTANQMFPSDRFHLSED
jgi:hypothetical protein